MVTGPELLKTMKSFIEACEKGDAERVRTLLESEPGMVYSAQDGMGRRGLGVAVDRGHRDVVEVLIDMGANPNAYGGVAANSPLYVMAQSSPWDGEMAELLVSKGADVNNPNAYGGRPLHALILAGGDRSEAAEFLLGNGADVDLADDHGRTPLQLAESQGRDDLVRLFNKGRRRPSAGGAAAQHEGGASTAVEPGKTRSPESRSWWQFWR